MPNAASTDARTSLYSSDSQIEKWARANFGDLIDNPAFAHEGLKTRFRNLVNDAYQANESGYGPDMERFGLLDIHGRNPEVGEQIADRLWRINFSHSYLRQYVLELRKAAAESKN